MPKLDLSKLTVKTGAIYPEPYASQMAGRSSLRLGDAGGLTQFGANLVMLQPGAKSSLRHWHHHEDEFVMVTRGECTLVQDAGPTTLRAGDCAAFPAGVADGHHFMNHTAAEAAFLVIGTKAAHEVAIYSDVDLRLEVDGKTATFTRRDGSPLGEDSGRDSHAPTVTPRKGGAVAKLTIPALSLEDGYEHPMLGGGLGPYSYAVLGELGGLTQFGVHIEVLPPGSRSSFRHWHRDEDEFVMMLSGEVMLIEDTETPLGAGDVACWAKGSGPAHCLENRSKAEARYVVIGTRKPQDEIHYPDHDLIAVKDGTARRYTHSDGRPRTKGDSDER